MKNQGKPGRHTIFVTAAMMAAATLLLTGCGDTSPKYFEYDSEADEISGKINLNRITYIVPRLKVGAVRAGADLEPFVAAGRPKLQVVGLDGGEPEIASA